MELIDTSGWPFWMVIAVFAGTGLVIAVAGSVMTRTADRLSDLSNGRAGGAKGRQAVAAVAVGGIIGFESLLVLIVYLAGSAVLFSQG